MLNRELKKGLAELIILSMFELRARHGYEISKLIETRSTEQLKFHVASLYPLLYRWRSAAGCKAGGSRRPGNAVAAFTV
jgi:DNA-binding PadR family transcriptional regulator